MGMNTNSVCGSIGGKMSNLEFDEIVNELERAVTFSVNELFENHQNEDFYYISLITSGEGFAPILTAWSYQELSRVANKGEEDDLKWSYADSPYTMYRNPYFERINIMLDNRNTDELSDSEFNFRINAMVKAMKQADEKGVFGSGENRLNLLLNVEVMPPDSGNVERAIQLNPENSKILPIWIEEAGEI